MITDSPVAEVDDVHHRINGLIAERKAALDAAERMACAAAGRPLTLFEGSLLDGFLDDFDRADGRLRTLVVSEPAWRRVISNDADEFDRDLLEATRLLQHLTLDVRLSRRERHRLVRLVRRVVRTGPRAGVTAIHQGDDEGIGYR